MWPSLAPSMFRARHFIIRNSNRLEWCFCLFITWEVSFYLRCNILSPNYSLPPLKYVILSLLIHLRYYYTQKLCENCVIKICYLLSMGGFITVIRQFSSSPSSHLFLTPHFVPKEKKYSYQISLNKWPAGNKLSHIIVLILLLIIFCTLYIKSLLMNKMRHQISPEIIGGLYIVEEIQIIQILDYILCQNLYIWKIDVFCHIMSNK